MRIKWTGEQDEITLRGVTFEKGKAVDVADTNLATKCLGISGFVEVKRGRKKNDKDKS